MRVLAFFAFLLFGVYALGARWYYVCQLRGLCEEAPPPLVDVRPKTLQLIREDSVLLSGYEEFAFDSAQALPRLNTNNQAFLDTLAAILLADTSTQLTITGRYRPQEAAIKSVGIFENIGVARADALRKLLLQREIPETRIFLDYSQSGDPALRSPAGFVLFKPSAGPNSYENVAFTFTNMTFSDANFEFDSDVFTPGEPFKMYADSVKTYLLNYPKKKMTIIGHTDDIGDAKYNLNLGERRARNTRDYFRKLGVEAEIEVSSMGEAKPTASNTKPEGRQKNRRVNFVIE